MVSLRKIIRKSALRMLPMSLKKSTIALGSGTKVNTLHISDSNLSEGILEGAKKAKADVIVMASHKRTGIKGVLLGSETHEVIVHSKLPVLVLG